MNDIKIIESNLTDAVKLLNELPVEQAELIHDYVDYALRLVKRHDFIGSVSNNGDRHLEKINDIMWNSCMIKGRDFGRKEGFKIMEILEDWATPK